MQAENALYLIVLGMPVIVTSMLSFDRVVRWEHACRHADWKKDGSPRGFFWHPDDALLWRSEGAKQSKFFVWLVTAPSWVAEMKTEKKYFAAYRGCVYAWLAALATFWLFVSG